MSIQNAPVKGDDVFGLARAAFRKFVHFCSFHFIMNSKRTSTKEVAGLKLTVPPTVFDPKIFVTSAFFANFLQGLDLRGQSVAEVGTGSGILALSAAKAGAAYVLALDINPNAVKAAAQNAIDNNLPQVEARESNLFSAVPDTERFDLVISNPPYLSGEPRNLADRAWHAGPGYRDILGLFDQTAARLKEGGRMLLLLSSDSNLTLFNSLIANAGMVSRKLATQSILVESFDIYEVVRR